MKTRCAEVYINHTLFVRQIVRDNTRKIGDHWLFGRGILRWRKASQRISNTESVSSHAVIMLKTYHHAQVGLHTGLQLELVAMPRTNQTRFRGQVLNVTFVERSSCQQLKIAWWWEGELWNNRFRWQGDFKFKRLQTGPDWRIMVGICALDNVHSKYFGEQILHDDAISRLRIELRFHGAYMTNFPKKNYTL